MSTEIREWMNEIWEYCQENWTVVAAFAGIGFILLVSVFLIFTARRDDGSVTELEPERFAEPEEPESEPAASDASPEPEELPLQECSDVDHAVQQLIKSVEAAGGASGQKVESVELRIENARLTIRYAGEWEEVKEGRPENGTFTWKDAEREAEDFAGEKEPVKQFKPEESTQPKKFGTENMNTARSGRVYTEEELLNQIRD